MKTQDNHGLDQAHMKAASIAAMVAALTCDYERLQELRDEREAFEDNSEALAQWTDENADELNDLEHAAGDCTEEEEARTRIQEDPLSIEVRSGWIQSGGEMEATEFRIVLCTGGPHVEIMGELDAYQQPRRAWLQYQDWGTPMTQFFNIEQSTLLTYCQEFYFEG
jgi:hypothetical protein